MDADLLWEILVPTIRKGKPVRVRSHRVWDTEVRKIAGGLTIFKPAKGEWVSPEGELFSERMIPVRIKCSKQQIEQIADLTAKFYKQDAIMYYLISTQAYIKHYTDEGCKRVK